MLPKDQAPGIGGNTAIEAVRADQELKMEIRDAGENLSLTFVIELRKMTTNEINRNKKKA
ncbi:MAG: hypothetical protein Q7J65_00040 [Candidatus Marinimicrobia bacterium]|nr:hypothetical protein [Candidatus Neomarinimicrobiota bacterium]